MSEAAGSAADQNFDAPFYQKTQNAQAVIAREGGNYAIIALSHLPGVLVGIERIRLSCLTG